MARDRQRESQTGGSQLSENWLSESLCRAGANRKWRVGLHWVAQKMVLPVESRPSVNLPSVNLPSVGHGGGNYRGWIGDQRGYCEGG